MSESAFDTLARVTGFFGIKGTMDFLAQNAAAKIHFPRFLKMLSATSVKTERLHQIYPSKSSPTEHVVILRTYYTTRPAKLCATPRRLLLEFIVDVTIPQPLVRQPIASAKTNSYRTLEEL
jgi:hypothetical protein